MLTPRTGQTGRGQGESSRRGSTSAAVVRNPSSIDPLCRAPVKIRTPSEKEDHRLTSGDAAQRAQDEGDGPKLAIEK